MILEALCVVGGLVALALVVEWVLIMIYGAFRPTRLFWRITPCICFIAAAFYVLGRYGIFNFYAAIAVLGLVAVVTLANFMWVEARVTKPLNASLNRIRKESNQVALIAAKVSSAGKSLAQGASRQSTGIEETSTAMEQMAAVTRQNATSAGNAKEIMAKAAEVMDRVQRHMTGMDQSIREISESSAETDKIIKSIEEIAFQTNLLALNAAVEAARAGEAGSGFAIVANEVRNLAMRASEAAKGSGGLLENTVRSVANGSDLNKATQSAFKDNIEMSLRIRGIIEEVASASHEQAEGIGQVSTAISEIGSITEQNTTDADLLASSSVDMQKQAVQMKNFVHAMIALLGIRHRATKKEAREMALKASACIKSKGNSAFAEISDPDGRFIDRDLFVTVYNEEGLTLAHGLNRYLSVVGKIADVKDARGRNLALSLVDYMKGRKDGWYDYEFTNPVTHAIEKKTAYVVKIGQMCVAVAADREK